MDAPVYQLHQVVQNHGELEDFEGPLDLILHLLSINKIEIADISISLVLEQYLAYLERRKQMDLEIASDFVAMAAQLMFIKSRMLLSLEDEAAKSEMELLQKSLEERQNHMNFAKVRAVSEQLGVLGEFGRNIFTRAPETVEQGKIPVYDHTPEDLTAAMEEFLAREERRAPPPVSRFAAIVRHEPYPVTIKAGELMVQLKRLGTLSFHLLFRGSRSRSEVVATFLALLELCKNRKIQLAGGVSDAMVMLVSETEDVSAR